MERTLFWDWLVFWLWLRKRGSRCFYRRYSIQVRFKDREISKTCLKVLDLLRRDLEAFCSILKIGLILISMIWYSSMAICSMDSWSRTNIFGIWPSKFWKDWLLWNQWESTIPIYQSDVSLLMVGSHSSSSILLYFRITYRILLGFTWLLIRVNRRSKYFSLIKERKTSSNSKRY